MQTLLITRRLPDAVLEAARARFDVTLRDRTDPLSAQELRIALRDYDAVLPTLGDRFQPDVFADVPHPRAKILALVDSGAVAFFFDLTGDLFLDH